MKFKDGAIKPGMVIHCSSNEEAMELMKQCRDLGYQMLNRGDPVEYIVYANEDYGGTVYYLGTQKEKSITFSSLQRALENGYKPTEFSDLIESEPRFKVGDKVRVKNSLNVGTMYGALHFIEAMTQDIGKVLTILSLNNTRYGFIYNTKESAYNWSEEMLEPVENSTGGETSTDSFTRPLDTSTEMSAVEVLEWLNKHYGDGEYKKVFGIDLTSTEFLIEEERGLSAQEVVDKITAYEAAKKEKPVEVENLLICHVYEWQGDIWQEVKRVEHIVDGECKNEYEIMKQDLLDYRQSPQWRHECYVVSERRCRAKGE